MLIAISSAFWVSRWSAMNRFNPRTNPLQQPSAFWARAGQASSFKAAILQPVSEHFCLRICFSGFAQKADAPDLLMRDFFDTGLPFPHLIWRFGVFLSHSYLSQGLIST